MARVSEPQEYILYGRKATDQGMVLEDRRGYTAHFLERHSAIEPARAGNGDRAVRRFDEAIQRPDQRRLAHAGWADDRGDPSFFEGERNIPQNLSSSPAHREALSRDQPGRRARDGPGLRRRSR